MSCQDKHTTTDSNHNSPMCREHKHLPACTANKWNSHLKQKKYTNRKQK